MTISDIEQRVGIPSSTEKIFLALTEPKQLDQWWSEGAEGESKVGSTLKIRFGQFIQPIKVAAIEPPKLVRWEAGNLGAPFWAGTAIEFRLERDNDHNQTLVHFKHSGWQTKVMFAKTSIKWAGYLLSLKGLLEKGTGRPFPNEWPVDHD